MKRAFLFILGMMLLVVGVAAAGAGTVVAFAIGPDGTFTAEVGDIKGEGYALVFNEFQVDTKGNTDSLQRLGDLTAGARSSSGTPVFIGIAPAADVATYLAGVSRDVVSDINGGVARVVPIPGAQQPTAPQQQSFWVVQAAGASPMIKLPKDAAGQVLVIMNVTPSQPMAVVLTVGVDSNLFFPIGIVLIVIGLILIILAVWALVKAAKSRKTRLPPTGYAPGPPGPIYPGQYQQQPYQPPAHQPFQSVYTPPGYAPPAPQPDPGSSNPESQR